MEFIKRNWRGILVCLVIAIPSWILGKLFPIAGRSSYSNYCRNGYYNVLE